MDYDIWDSFMIRTPAIPFCYLEEYRNSNKDIYEFISENEFLDNFFKNALLISSKSLYYSYINKPEKGKKYRNLCQGLLKYFIRASSRPTPYGSFANVSIGEFGQNTKIEKEYEIIDIKVDTDWANGLIKKLEDDSTIFKKLYLKFNDICYASGDRLKNPYFANRGNLTNSSEEIKENSIRFTNLVKLVKNNSNKFIKYSDLFYIIKNEYEDVDDLLIQNTIKNLMENEYLFTNLRLPAYCNDILAYLIEILEKIIGARDITDSLKKLNSLFSEYKKSREVSTLEKIYNIMKSLNESSNYIELNTGCKYSSKILDSKLKNKIENFVNEFTKISPEINNYGFLSNFKNKFMEKYGNNVEVDLIEIIDENKFNGLAYLNDSFNASGGEKEIIKIIKNKIEIAIFNDKEVYLVKGDFKNIDNSKLKLTKGFDLNLYITKSNEDYNLIVGPNGGSPKEGSMFQRFSDSFVKKDFDEYNKIYKKSRELIQDNYIEVELRECTVSGRTSNVVNNTKNYEYYLPIGLAGNKNKSLMIDDLVIGLDDKENFYIKSKSLNKKLKFIKDNMLNTRLNSKLYQLLYELSSLNEDVPVNRIFALGTENYIYSPRIYFEGVIISLKKWKFDYLNLSKEKYNDFKRDLLNLKKEYTMDDLVYLSENDNRLMLDLNREESLELLYSTYKKTGEIKLTEIEPGLKNSLVDDKKNRVYLNEFVFSFIQEEYKIANTSIDSSLNIESKNKIFMPFQDGWIYLKLYGLGNRINEFLTRHLDIIDDLGNPTWFFIRYEDTYGPHIRLRFKFKDQDEALEKFKIIDKWLESLYSINIINKVELDSYERETNRYGGEKLIELFEEYSQISSELAIETLRNYKDIDIEKIYFFEIFYLYMSASHNLEDLFVLLDRDNLEKEFRKEYREKRKELISIGERILSLKYGDFESLKPYIQNINRILKKYREKMDYLYNENNLTNTDKMIIGSLTHMHCNRLTGDRGLEYKTFVMIRHTIYDLLNKKKYLKRKL